MFPVCSKDEPIRRCPTTSKIVAPCFSASARNCAASSREAWENNGRPEHLRAACEASMRRLKLERIDIYQLHAPDPQVPLDESVGALAELQSEGKIRHIGLSNISVNELCRAQRIVPIVSVQNRYNFSDRSSEDVLAECEKGGLAFLPWHPLAAMRRGLVRLAASRAAEAQRPCRWQSLGCWPARPSLFPFPGHHRWRTLTRTSPPRGFSFRPKICTNCPETVASGNAGAEAIGSSRLANTALRTPRHRKRLRVLHFEPMGRAPRAIRRILPFGHDTFEPINRLAVSAFGQTGH